MMMMILNKILLKKIEFHVSKVYLFDGEKAWWQLHMNAVSNFEQVLEATPHKATAVRPPTSHHENYQS